MLKSLSCISRVLCRRSVFKTTRLVKECYITTRMNYSLVSLITSELNKNKILQISKLKDSQWSFGINSQIGWFKKY